MKNKVLRFRQVLDEEEVSRDDIIDMYVNYIDEDLLLKIVDMIKNMDVKNNE